MRVSSQLLCGLLLSAAGAAESSSGLRYKGARPNLRTQSNEIRQRRKIKGKHDDPPTSPPTQSGGFFSPGAPNGPPVFSPHDVEHQMPSPVNINPAAQPVAQPVFSPAFPPPVSNPSPTQLPNPSPIPPVPTQKPNPSPTSPPQQSPTSPAPTLRPNPSPTFSPQQPPPPPAPAPTPKPNPSLTSAPQSIGPAPTPQPNPSPALAPQSTGLAPTPQPNPSPTNPPRWPVSDTSSGSTLSPHQVIPSNPGPGQQNSPGGNPSTPSPVQQPSPEGNPSTGNSGAQPSPGGNPIPGNPGGQASLTAGPQAPTSPAPTPVDPSCEAARDGEVYVTDDSMKVTYFYEVSTTVNRSKLNDVASAIDNTFKNFLAINLVDCSKAANSEIQGVSPGDADKYAGDLCEGITFYDVSTHNCYLMEGTVELYLSRSSQLTTLEIRDLVWSTLRQEINGGARRHGRSLKSSLINEDAEIDDLFFVSDEREKNEADPVTGTIAARSGKSTGISGALSAALVGIFVFIMGIIGFALVKKCRSEEGEQHSQQSAKITSTFSQHSAGSEAEQNSPAPSEKRSTTPLSHRGGNYSDEVSVRSPSERSEHPSPSVYDFDDVEIRDVNDSQSYNWSHMGVSMLLTTDQLRMKGLSPISSPPTSNGTELYDRSIQISPDSVRSSLGGRTPTNRKASYSMSLLKTPGKLPNTTRSILTPGPRQSTPITPTKSPTPVTSAYTPGKSPASTSKATSRTSAKSPISTSTSRTPGKSPVSTSTNASIWISSPEGPPVEWAPCTKRSQYSDSTSWTPGTSNSKSPSVVYTPGTQQNRLRHSVSRIAPMTNHAEQHEDTRLSRGRSHTPVGESTNARGEGSYTPVGSQTPGGSSRTPSTRISRTPVDITNQGTYTPVSANGTTMSSVSPAALKYSRISRGTSCQYPEFQADTVQL